MGSGWKQAVHPDDLPEILRRWERAVKGGEPCELAFRLRRSDAVYRWFQGRAEPLLDNDNRTVGWFAACGESDDPARAEQGLRPALTPGQGPDRKLLEKALAIGVLTPDGTLIEANKAPLEAAKQPRSLQRR